MVVRLGLSWQVNSVNKALLLISKLPRLVSRQIKVVNKVLLLTSRLLRLLSRQAKRVNLVLLLISRLLRLLLLQYNSVKAVKNSIPLNEPMPLLLTSIVVTAPASLSESLPSALVSKVWQ